MVKEKLQLLEMAQMFDNIIEDIVNELKRCINILDNVEPNFDKDDILDYIEKELLPKYESYPKFKDIKEEV